MPGISVSGSLPIISILKPAALAPPPFPHYCAKKSSFLRKRYVKSARTMGAARVAAPMLGFSKGNRRQKRPGPDSYGIILSKFDPRKNSGISRIAVVNSGCKHARAHTRFECGFYQRATACRFSKRVSRNIIFYGSKLSYRKNIRLTRYRCRFESL